jgi:hypothetical protein
LHEPSAGAVAQRVLAIQSKRCGKKPVDYLTRTESEAVLAARIEPLGRAAVIAPCFWSHYRPACGSQS